MSNEKLIKKSDIAAVLENIIEYASNEHISIYIERKSNIVVCISIVFDNETCEGDTFTNYINFNSDVRNEEVLMISTVSGTFLFDELNRLNNDLNELLKINDGFDIASFDKVSYYGGYND